MEQTTELRQRALALPVAIEKAELAVIEARAEVFAFRRARDHAMIGKRLELLALKEAPRLAGDREALEKEAGVLLQVELDGAELRLDAEEAYRDRLLREWQTLLVLLKAP